MLTQQEISDRIEIQNLITAYSFAVDKHQWDLFDEIFTADADLDYSEISNRRGDRAYLRSWLSERMPTYDRPYQHLSGPSRILLDGDSAEAHTICYNPMPLGESGLRLFGHWYHDDLTRTADGWRIHHRRLEPCYSYPLGDVEPTSDGGQ